MGMVLGAVCGLVLVLLGAVVAELEGDVGGIHARDLDRVVAVGISEGGGVPLGLVAVLEPEGDLSCGELLDGVAAPVAAEAATIVAISPDEAPNTL